MSKCDLIVIDYGMGNVWSVLSALRYLGCSPAMSGDPEIIAQAGALLLPGVGSFRNAMARLKQRGIDQAIVEAVRTGGGKILGICLGMQLLGIRSCEDGDTPGLGLIPQVVERIAAAASGPLKIPHIGFDSVHSQPGAHLFRGLPDAADFYFVHSYRMLPGSLDGKVATCCYGAEFLAAYEKDNIYATQFHPEKSQTNGLVLLGNFLNR